MSMEGYVLPASFGQERLWFVDQMEPGLTAYNIAFVKLLRRGLDPDRFEAALRELVKRHETLRTGLELRDGELAQIVLPELHVDVERTDLRGLDESEQAARLAEIHAADAARPIPLDRAPLWQTKLFRLSEDEWQGFFLFHHIIFDGTSVEIFITDLAALYDGKTLPEPPIQYGDFAAWQRGRWDNGELADQLAYWKKQLAEPPPPLELSPRAPDPEISRHAGGDVGFDLPPELTRRVRELAAARGATPFAVLLAALQALVGRLTGREDVLVGTPVSGRDRPETAGLIGIMVNTVVVRGDCRREVPFTELLAQVRANLLDALDNQEVPYERLVEEVRTEGADGEPLHQIVFNLLPLAENIQLRNGTAKVDLLIDLVEEGDRISGRMEYAKALFDLEWAENFAARYRLLLGGVLADPATPVGRLPILLPGEEPRGRTGEMPERRSVTEVFAALVRERPGAVAVADADGGALTYGELDRRSGRLAALLAPHARPDTPIAVLLGNEVELAVAVLAVLKAGAAFLPLDARHPVERVRYQLADSGATAIVTGRATRLPETGLPILDPADAPGEAAPAVARHPGQLAYVIYTSGSTGRPKGVGVADGELTAYVSGVTGLLGLAPGRRLSMLQPLTYDFAITVFFGALLTGGTLHLVPRELATDAYWVAEHLRREAVDIYKVTPSHLAALQSGLPDPAALLPRRTLVLGGEASRWEWVRELRAAAGPERSVVNHYGPTETTVGVLALAGDQTPHGAGTITPVGHALPHATAYVLDAGLRPVPDGVPGELCVGGVSVSRGYLGRPASTAAVFVPDPFSGVPGARLYRTGDRARRLPDGSVEFLGRADDQVKIRGFRVEPGEVQAAVAAYPAVRECAVVARDGELTAYVVGAVEAAALRAHLAERLPDYMVPAHVVSMDGLPLAAHGKLDRSRLPAPAAAAASAGAPPSGASEELVAALFRQLLDCGPVGRDDSFLELGGHSLLAIKLMSRVRTAFGAAPPLRALFENPTVAGLAAKIDAALSRRGERLPPVVPVPRGTGLPASYGQRRLWFLDQLEPAAAVYNTHVCLRVRGDLDPVRLARALLGVADRHEVLRTRLEERDDDLIVRVEDEPEVPFAVTELPGGGPARALRLLEEEGSRRFDLTTEPPLRAHLVRMAADDHVLLVTLHHVVNDAWSAVLFQRELAEIYAALGEDRRPGLPELPVQYADYAAWQRARVEGPLRETQLAYWRERLAGRPERLELPADRPRPARRSYAGANVPISVPAPLAERLRGLGAEENASLFMTLLAAFSVLLARHSGQDDILVGTPAANRPRPEVEPLLGFFLNTLAVRADLSADPTFRELLKQVRTTSLEAFANDEVPFEVLIEDLQPRRDLGGTPLVQVMLSLEDAERPPVSAGGLRFEWLPSGTAHAKFDLTLYLRRESDGLHGILEYRTDLFDAGTVERLAARFLALLTAAVADPDRPVSSLPLLTPAENALIEEWNDTGSFASSPSLPELLARQVAATPEAVAVVGPSGDALTYADFSGRVRGLAGALRAAGAGAGSVVGVCLPRSVDLVVAVHAVVTAGGAYLPLEPSHPDERLTFLTGDAGAHVIITDAADRFPGHTTVPPTASLPATARQSPTASRLPTASLLPSAAGGDAGGGLPEISPHAPAYVIYTSGSTGTPKGVVISHAAISNRLRWMSEAFPLTPGDRILHKTPFTFDVSVWELFWPLITGASMVVAGPGAHRDTAELVRLIGEHRVTTVHFVPSLLDALLEERPALPSLRRVICSGEALPTSLAGRFHAALPDVELHNLYGPTEAAVDVTWHACEPGESRTPIGRPITGIRVEILDRNGERVPIGAPGELCIGGVGLAHGYLGRPGLTARQFTPSPHGRLYRTGDLARWLPDGEIEYLGRIDHQVKIRGIRVEPGETEAALTAHPSVRSAVVLARRGSLVGYLVAEPEIDLPALTAHLRARLPEHLVPAQYAVLEELPLTPNGKLDRSALPEPRPAAAPVHEPPAGPEEEAVAQVWAQVLGVGDVGAHDNFFALGGDSIQSLKVVARLRGRGYRLALERLFTHQTVRELATTLEHGPAAESATRAAFGLLGAGDLDRIKRRFQGGRP
ncbi:amino acid adenylation domain-containing protein [Nonomuraea sp. NPDC050540]|uniref:amino acid adenylation domain-containing protein n=1 Tax=Nonomuraea sp. NPDC050540 TaxID=3364367 RepID=UPI0037B6648F